MKWIAPLCLLAAPALAQTCPEAPDHSTQLSEILSELKSAQNEMAGRELSNRLWELWTDAPDATAQGMLDDGMSRRSVYDLLGARRVFSRLIDYCPNYAEGYNQRAFASFLSEDYEGALADLDRTLAIIPNHVGALSGKALTLIALGRNEEGQAALRAAVDLNPWLQERALLDPPLGTDL
jgi:tetratricopeptide (TPR) repeat protein